MRQIGLKSMLLAALLAVVSMLAAPATSDAATAGRTASLTARLAGPLATVAADGRVTVRLRAEHAMRVRLRLSASPDAYMGPAGTKTVQLRRRGRYRVRLPIDGSVSASLARPSGVLRVAIRYRGLGHRGRLALTLRGEPAPGDAGAAPPVAPPRCPEFGSAVNVGSVDFAAATELSGLAASRRNPGALWTHNDSGDTERVFAMDVSARLIGTYTVSGTAQQDWEDIAVGPGPEAGLSYVYIGSIGGNSGRHALHVYRAPEPLIAAGGSPFTTPLPSTVKLEMQYPGSEAYDAEALLADTSGDLYVVTKSYAGVAKVFRYPLAAQDTPATTYTLDLVATLDLGGAITAGDISPDGGEIVLKGYATSYLWPRVGGASVASALGAEPCAIPHGNGEALGFSSDAGSYFTITEGAGVPLFRFDRSPG